MGRRYNLGGVAEVLAGVINESVTPSHTESMGLILPEDFRERVAVSLEENKSLYMGLIDRSNPESERPNFLEEYRYGYQRLVLEKINDSYMLSPLCVFHGIGNTPNPNSAVNFINIMNCGFCINTSGSIINYNQRPDCLRDEPTIYGTGWLGSPQEFAREYILEPGEYSKENTNSGAQYSVVAFQTLEPAYTPAVTSLSRMEGEISVGSVAPSDLLGIVYLPEDWNEAHLIALITRGLNCHRASVASDMGFSGDVKKVNLLFVKEGKVISSQLEDLPLKYRRALGRFCDTQGIGTFSFIKKLRHIS